MFRCVWWWLWRYYQEFEMRTLMRIRQIWSRNGVDDNGSWRCQLGWGMKKGGGEGEGGEVEGGEGEGGEGERGGNKKVGCICFIQGGFLTPPPLKSSKYRKVNLGTDVKVFGLDNKGTGWEYQSKWGNEDKMKKRTYVNLSNQHTTNADIQPETKCWYYH